MKKIKRLTAAIMAVTLALGITACGKDEKVIDTFNAEYEMKGTTSSGAPKNDTFIFNGTTEDGIITELNFDIIRNKGTEKEYSKKDIMGYSMNISDGQIENVDGKYKLTQLSSCGYDPKFEGTQFLINASCDEITDETTFKELNVSNIYTGEEVSLEQALIAYKYVAAESGVENFNEDTLVKDMLSAHGLYKDGAFVEGNKRVSFDGYNGGRSYGEQIDAIANHILNEKMTLEEVYEMFKTVNQMEEPIEERDAISGATITFVGDFQRMAYVAIHGELYEGVVSHREKDGNTVVEVVTQGFGGEIETNVSFDSEGKIVAIEVRDANETADIGGVLTAEGSDYIKALIDGQAEVQGVEAVSGATVTSNALNKAVVFALEYFNTL